MYRCYALYFYLSSLSLRKTAEILSWFFIKRNLVFIWNWWIQIYRPTKKLLSSTKRRIEEFIVGETRIKIGFK